MAWRNIPEGVAPPAWTIITKDVEDHDQRRSRLAKGAMARRTIGLAGLDQRQGHEPSQETRTGARAGPGQADGDGPEG